MKTWFTCALVVLVAGAVAWPKSTAVVTGATPAPAQVNAPVQLVPGGQRQAGSPGEKGATYYALEGQTTRLTTKFHDGRVAVAERGLIGEVTTTLRDRGGNQRARLTVNRIDGAHDLIHFEPADAAPFQASSDPASVKPTLDWASRQAYGLDKDGASNLVWDKGTMRPKGAAPRDVESDVDEVETVWADGLVATLTRRDLPPLEIVKGRTLGGRALVTELTSNGVSAGRSIWFEQHQVFAYHLPGLTDGVVWIGPEHLKEQYGGWPFKPDTTWINLQTIAAHHFRTQITKQGFVARKCDAPKPNRLAQFFFPTVAANEPGCDRLHYFDGTIVRECCDDHDRCYSKNGCTEKSWWQVWKSWSCDVCNMVVVSCFMAGDMIDPCRDRAWWGC